MAANSSRGVPVVRLVVLLRGLLKFAQELAAGHPSIVEHFGSILNPRFPLGADGW